MFLELRLAAGAVLAFGIPGVISVDGFCVGSLKGGSGKDKSWNEKGGDSLDIL